MITINGNTYTKLSEALESLRLLGVYVTIVRSDGKPLINDEADTSKQPAYAMLNFINGGETRSLTGKLKPNNIQAFQDIIETWRDTISKESKMRESLEKLGVTLV